MDKDLMAIALFTRILNEPDSLLIYTRGKELVLDGHIPINTEELEALRELGVTTYEG